MCKSRDDTHNDAGTLSLMPVVFFRDIKTIVISRLRGPGASMYFQNAFFCIFWIKKNIIVLLYMCILWLLFLEFAAITWDWNFFKRVKLFNKNNCFVYPSNRFQILTEDRKRKKVYIENYISISTSSVTIKEPKKWAITRRVYKWVRINKGQNEGTINHGRKQEKKSWCTTRSGIIKEKPKTRSLRKAIRSTRAHTRAPEKSRASKTGGGSHQAFPFHRWTLPLWSRGQGLELAPPSQSVNVVSRATGTAPASPTELSHWLGHISSGPSCALLPLQESSVEGKKTAWSAVGEGYTDIERDTAERCCHCRSGGPANLWGP